MTNCPDTSKLFTNDTYCLFSIIIYNNIASYQEKYTIKTESQFNCILQALNVLHTFSCRKSFTFTYFKI